MKKFTIIILGVIGLWVAPSVSEAQVYQLGSHTQTVGFVFAGGTATATDMYKCEDIHGSNSVIRGMAGWEINARDFEKFKIYCRRLKRDGTIDRNDNTASGNFFNTSRSGERKATTINMSRLPVGIYGVACSNALIDFRLVSSTAEKIMDAGAIYREEDTARANEATDRDSCGVNPAASKYEYCPGGYVLTGLRLTRDQSGGTAKIKGGVLECTELLSPDRVDD